MWRSPEELAEARPCRALEEETTVGIIEAAGGALHMSREGLGLGRVKQKAGGRHGGCSVRAGNSGGEWWLLDPFWNRRQ